MSQPYLGEIRMFGGNFAPVGWAFCDGTLLPIAQNDALFAVIGATYGGNGQTTFALPDLRGRLPLHQGTGQSSYTPGQTGGAEKVTLTASQLPAHTHTLLSGGGTALSPANAYPGAASTTNPDPARMYGAAVGLTAFNPATITVSPGGQPHDNFQPYLCVNFIIALVGVFPSQS
jgi:microcystin-dependent protein